MQFYLQFLDTKFLGFTFTWLDVGTFLIMVINFFGTFLNSRQKASGFFIWGLCNILWAYVNFFAPKGVFWQGIQNIIFIGFNIYGYLCWKYTAAGLDQKLRKLFCCKKCHKKDCHK